MDVFKLLENNQKQKMFFQLIYQNVKFSIQNLWNTWPCESYMRGGGKMIRKSASSQEKSPQRVGHPVQLVTYWGTTRAEQ